MSRTAISAELARKEQGGAMSFKEFTKDENKLSIEEIANEIMSNFQHEGYDANLAQDKKFYEMGEEIILDAGNRRVRITITEERG
jgi:hypothetical protein